MTNFLTLHLESLTLEFTNTDFDVYGTILSAPYPLGFNAMNVTVYYSKPEKGFYFETRCGYEGAQLTNEIMFDNIVFTVSFYINLYYYRLNH